MSSSDGRITQLHIFSSPAKKAAGQTPSSTQIHRALAERRIVRRLYRKDGDLPRIVFSSVDWHRDIGYALHSGKWENVRHQLSLVASYTSTAIDPDNVDRRNGNRKKPFWRRLSLGVTTSRTDSGRDPYGLLQIDRMGQTPLHLALSSRNSPTDVLMALIKIERRAASIRNYSARVPLFYAVVYRHHIETAAALVDAFPEAMSLRDSKGLTPLSYAFEIAEQESVLCDIPRTYWMPASGQSEEAAWQELQGERWSMVRLLLASAMYPQTNLSVGGNTSMLIDAMMHSAPPIVISLLIGASTSLLSHENRATAFAASTLYTAITRHYPLSILVSLASKCPKDVRSARDETGMGLLAAHFISACFETKPNTYEWAVSPSFFSSIRECIVDQEMHEEGSAFVDWWRKVEFLIAFCAGEDPSRFPKDLLLHAALTNSDTPPAIIRVLLSVYTSSVTLSDHRNRGAFPIHLAAKTREYSPRNYERPILESECVLDMIVAANPKGAFRRCERRLPLHFAIDSGKTWTSIANLVSANNDALNKKDPVSGLYPFQQVASYSNKSQADTFRVMCVTRNKYSHAVWKGLSDRQKDAAVARVFETEDINRLWTIFECLRRQVNVIDTTEYQRSPVDMAQGCSGVGLIATHFLSWCYTLNQSQKLWRANIENVETLRRAEQLLLSGGNLEGMTSDFLNWLSKLRFCIENSSQSSSRQRQLPIQREEDKFLLHNALSNPGTPPQIIRFLLSLSPDSIFIPLPGTDSLPLHIICQTIPYTAMRFEPIHIGSMKLVLDANPEVVNVSSRGQLPLHIAILAGKTWEDLKPLVFTHTGALQVKDAERNLYPFQLMAVERSYSVDLRLHLQYKARNAFKTSTWNQLSPLDQIKMFRRVQREYQLNVLSSVFELLRTDSSVLEHSGSAIEWSKLKDLPKEIEGQDADEPNRETSDATDCEQLESFFTCKGDSMSSRTVVGLTTNIKDQDSDIYLGESGLKTFLSKQSSRHTHADQFKCEVSVLSIVDVMSIVSTLAQVDSKHLQKRKRNGDVRVELSQRDDSESSYEFAEDLIEIDATLHNTAPENSTGGIVAEKEDKEALLHDNESEHGRDGNPIHEKKTFFQLRRKARNFSRNECEHPTQARSVRKRGDPILMSSSFSNGSASVSSPMLREALERSRRHSRQQMKAPPQGLRCSKSDEKEIFPLKEMTRNVDSMQVGNGRYGSLMLGNLDQSSDCEEQEIMVLGDSLQISMELSPPSSAVRKCFSLPEESAHSMTEVSAIEEDIRSIEMMWIHRGESVTARKGKRPTQSLRKVIVGEKPIATNISPFLRVEENLTTNRSSPSNLERFLEQERCKRTFQKTIPEPGQSRLELPAPTPGRDMDVFSSSGRELSESDAKEQFYFDFAKMRWEKRSKKLQFAHGEDIGSTLAACSSVKAVPFFDRESMRWRTVSEQIDSFSILKGKQSLRQSREQRKEAGFDKHSMKWFFKEKCEDSFGVHIY